MFPEERNIQNPDSEEKDELEITPASDEKDYPLETVQINAPLGAADSTDKEDEEEVSTLVLSGRQKLELIEGLDGTENIFTESLAKEPADKEQASASSYASGGSSPHQEPASGNIKILTSMGIKEKKSQQWALIGVGTVILLCCVCSCLILITAIASSGA